MREKKYLLDGEPVSGIELINQAAILEADYAVDWLKTTSRAASILRKHGYTVDDNPEWKEGEK